MSIAETKTPDTGLSTNGAGPFRLLKYFIISGFAAISIVTLLLGAFLYTRSVDTLLRGAENYARLLAENLNYNIFVGFYAPLKARGMAMDLRKWDQFGALDSLIKDFTYGLKIDRIKIIDKNRKIVYSTDYDLIGKYEPANQAVDEALQNGKDQTKIRQGERKHPAIGMASGLPTHIIPSGKEQEITGCWGPFTE